MLESVWQGLEASAIGSFIASSEWAFPTIETIHVIAVVTVFGTIAIMDLRLLGLTSRDQAVSSLSRDTLPLTWAGFVLAVITGSLLFVSKAPTYMVNPYFLVKIGLIAFAGLNMAIFHMLTWKSLPNWDNSVSAIPQAAKAAAFLSLLVWMTVIFCGRMIGFTLGIYIPA